MTSEALCEKIGWTPAECLVYIADPQGNEYPLDDMIVVEGRVVLLTKERKNADSHKGNAEQKTTNTSGGNSANREKYSSRKS